MCHSVVYVSVFYACMCHSDVYACNIVLYLLLGFICVIVLNMCPDVLYV